MWFQRGMLTICVLILPALLKAALQPVVITPPLSNDNQQLQSLGFILHARCGEDVIGRLPVEDQNRLAEGVIPLVIDGDEFNGVYQTDKRALGKMPNLVEKISVLYESKEWLLFYCQPEIFNLLSSSGIPFRAIPEMGKPISDPVEITDNLDTIDPFVGVILDQISSNSYANYLQTLEDFGTRNTYNSECNDAAFWIRQQFQDMGLSTWLDTFQIGSVIRYNVIAELEGTQSPDQVCYITAHYDATAGLPVLPEPEAPGADDDASGTALALECARVLSTGFTFQKTIRFAVFAGNEQGLIGSEAYVAGMSGGETIIGVLNADMVGWSGSDPWPPDLVIYSNNNPASISLANKMVEAITTFVSGFVEGIILQDATMVYADHSPFWDVGIPAVLAMEDEAWGIDLNPYYHSTEDLVEHLDIPYAIHVLEVILASAADLIVPNGSSEPYLTADGVFIDDSAGNNNGQIEYGEFVYLTIPVINAGGGDAEFVNVILLESDPYITFTDWQEYYGPIPSQDTVSVPNAFTANIAVNVPDEHQFDITVSMTSGTMGWNSIVYMVAHAPNIQFDEVFVDDSFGGNGDNHLDPGETADLEITLNNEGSYQAQSLSATLSCTSPDIIINSPTQSYGNLLPNASATRDFNLNVSSNTPPFFQANFTLNFSAVGGWTGSAEFTLDVGDLTYMPTGPDNYGYSAYDIHDQPYGPTYDWIEIDPNQGGPGTELDFNNDDETLHVNLPFTFVYYGQQYTELSICSNGWIACGYTEMTSYSNTSIPAEDGPPAMIAPFWDDLSPQQEGTVSYYYNAADGLFIVEYNDVRDFYPFWDNMTFEVVLYDPSVHQTATGDGKILFQYGNLDNLNSCTVGIENHLEDDGLLYLFNTYYDDHASAINEGMAILFTTGEEIPTVTVTLTPYGTPIQIPPTGGSFNFNIALANNGSSSVSLDVWCDVTLPNGSHYGPVLGPVALTLVGGFSGDRDRFQNVPAAAPAGNYSYNAYVGSYPSTIWNTDSFNFSKLASGTTDGSIVEDWLNWGESLDFSEVAAVSMAQLPFEFALGQNYPNPFNSETVIPLELPERSEIRIDLFNLQGRLVTRIFKGNVNAGWPKIHYNAKNLASGMYFYRITAEGLERGGKYQATGKMLLLK